MSDLLSSHPGVFEGFGIRMEPLERHHAIGLLEAADVDQFEFMIRTPEWTLAGFEEYIVARTSPGSYAWAVMQGGRVVGCSSIYSISLEHRHLEIGHSWVTASLRGTGVNPAMKLLMLTYAFEQFQAVRVQLKCDARNERSRNALRKLGTTFEGVLRNHMILPDGSLRQTAFFSILPEEWPEVKQKLLARLA